MSEKTKLIVSYVICILIIPYAVSYGINFLSSTGSIPAFTTSQITLLATVVEYLILIIIIIATLHKEFSKNIKDLFKHLKYLVPAIILLYGTSVLSRIFITAYDGTPTSTNQQALNTMIDSNLIISAIVLIIGAPIVEESIFRYTLISKTTGGMRTIMLFVSSILFGLVHQQVGFSIASLIAYTIMGFVLGSYYVYTNNLVFNILIHSGYNALAFVLLTFYSSYL